MLIDLLAVIAASAAIAGCFVWSLYGFAGRPAIPRIGRRARAARREREAAARAEAARLLRSYNAEVLAARKAALRALTPADRALLTSCGWEMPRSFAEEVRVSDAQAALKVAYDRDDPDAIRLARADARAAAYRSFGRYSTEDWGVPA